ncbi:hypothetical protein PSS63_23190, partial [Enterobacter hormaechei subsp. xiangfangensis]
RNDGSSVWVYYKWFVNSCEINYDLRSVSAENSSLDGSRVMLQCAEKVKDYDFSMVYLSYRGKVKFYLKGVYFKTLGQEDPLFLQRAGDRELKPDNQNAGV